MKLNADAPSTKNWIMLVVAITLAGGAAWLSKYYLDGKEEELRASIKGGKEVTQAIVVPKVNLKSGDVIDGSNMVVRKVPKRFVPDGAFTPGQFEQLAGRSIKFPISSGKPVIESNVSSVGIEQFSDLLEEGSRAITIPIDEFNSTAGMLVAGDRIDLFLLTEKEKMANSGNDEESVLVLVIENALVLATGKKVIDSDFENFDDSFNQYNSITLGVPLKDAARVGLAREDGKFIAMMRNRKDEMRVKHRVVEASEVYSRYKKRTRDVEFIIGGKGKSGVASSNSKSVDMENTRKKLSQLKEMVELSANQ